MPKVTWRASSRSTSSTTSFSSSPLGVVAFIVVKADSASPSMISCMPMNFRSQRGSVRILSSRLFSAGSTGYI